MLGREGEFYVFHLGWPDISARYNAVGRFGRISEVATRIAGQLPSEGQSAAFKEFVWRFVNVMARALVALGRKPDYQEINRYASDVEPLLVDYSRSFFPVIVIVLVVVGVLLWLINTYLPMDGKIKNILNIVVVIAIVIWLLKAFGLLGSIGSIRV